VTEHNEFSFKSKLWLWQAEKGSWHFISLPRQESDQIKFLNNYARVGFGSVKVAARIGDTEWSTSIFPDSKTGCFILPVKKEVREKEGLKAGISCKTTIKPKI
jgi:hypothetical protein